MKKIFIETKYSGKAKILNEKILPRKIGIVSTVQYLDQMSQISDILLKKDFKVKILKTKQIHPGQVLGCDVKFDIKGLGCILYIGDGRFHPIKIAFTYNLPVYTLEPRTGKITKIQDNDIKKYENKKKGAYLKFLSSDNIGILYSTKYGQAMPLEITKKIETKFPKKSFFSFLSDDIGYLENFPFINAWINTACPRIEEDFKSVNIADIL